MQCQICQKKDATIKFTHIINGVKSEAYMCRKCADEKGMNNPFHAMQPLLEQMILNMIQKKKKKSQPHGAYSQKICTGCGLSFQNFLDSGRLGCANCYTAFQEELKPLLRRIHGTTKHQSSAKTGTESKRRTLVRMRKDLDTAVRTEEFERAALLRDKMRELEKEIENAT